MEDTGNTAKELNMIDTEVKGKEGIKHDLEACHRNEWRHHKQKAYS